MLVIQAIASIIFLILLLNYGLSSEATNTDKVIMFAALMLSTNLELFYEKLRRKDLKK